MGVIYEFASFLANAKSKGTCFDEVVTIGHQTQYLSSSEIKRLATTLTKQVPSEQIENQEYVDELFKVLFGTKTIDSIDYSDYEKSDIIHDMSYPISTDHHQKYDVVIDGGSLEHVFNFPAAIANCMNLVKLGGSFFCFTPANNHMGHGFYQFSPELFYRIFNPENGFEIQEVILAKHPYPGVELSSKIQLYSVVDPVTVKQRVGLVCNSPAMMMVHAVRKEIKPLFNSFPIQSDYDALYSENDEQTQENNPDVSISKVQTFKNFAHRILGETIWRCLKTVASLAPKNSTKREQLRSFSFLNKQFYQRIK